MRRKLLLSIVLAVAAAALNASALSPALAFEGGGCSVASVAGSFGFSYTGVGILPSGQVPVAATGNFHSDFAGNLTGTEVNSLAGNATLQTIIGKISVNSDCSGNLLANVYEAGKLVRTSYIFLQYENNTNEVLGIFQKLVLPNNTTLPVVITISGKRLFTDRGH